MHFSLQCPISSSLCHPLIPWSHISFTKLCETVPPQQGGCMLPLVSNKTKEMELSYHHLSNPCGSSCVNYQNLEEIIPILTCFRVPLRLEQCELTQ